jgi:hypothetical protein
MHRSALALLGCVALALAVGCGRRPAPVRTVTTTGKGTSTRPKAKAPALRYKKPEAAAILGTGLVGAGAAGPLALACYADFALDTADLLDLAPRYDRPVIAGLLGTGLSGSAAAGPLHQLVYADVAASSFDQLGAKPPAARRGAVLLRGRDRLATTRRGHPMYVAVQTQTTRTASRPTTGASVSKPKGTTTTKRTTSSRTTTRRGR